jgi:hypothetical protein
LTLRAHSQKFVGILNGIDTESWNPASDLLINHQYNAEDIGGKAMNKRSLRATLGLAGSGIDSERPLVSLCLQYHILMLQSLKFTFDLFGNMELSYISLLIHQGSQNVL